MMNHRAVDVGSEFQNRVLKRKEFPCKWLAKRPVRTRMRGVVGRAGESPVLTRFMIFFTKINVSEVLGQSFQINISLIAIDMEYHV